MFGFGFLIYIKHLFDNSPPLGVGHLFLPHTYIIPQVGEEFQILGSKIYFGFGILGSKIYFGFGILGSKIYFVKRMYQVGGGAKPPVLLRLKTFPVGYHTKTAQCVYQNAPPHGKEKKILLMCLERIEYHGAPC